MFKTQDKGPELLHAIQSNSSEKKILKLLKAGASTTWYSSADHNFCLHWAVENKRPDLTQLLLRFNANYRAENKKGETPIELAAAKGYWNCVQAIAEVKNTDSLDTAHYGHALLQAIQTNQSANIVKCLLKARAPITWESSDDKNTCLHWAVINQRPDLIQLLLRYGANYRAKNERGKTPIELAAASGYWDCVQAIAEVKNTDSLDTAHYGSTLLTAVRTNQPIATVKRLLNASASTTWYTSKDRNTCLHWAMKNKNKKVADLLIAHSADKSAKNHLGLTPRQLATQKGQNLIPQLNQPAPPVQGEIPESVKDHLEDPISLESLTAESVITPQGNTYLPDSINDIIDQFGEDPIDRTGLTTEDLVPNRIIGNLIAHYEQSEKDMSTLPECLICPLSKEPFSNPVVADDGNTYERENLQAYLSEHNNETPTAGVKQESDISGQRYKNLFVAKIVSEVYANAINPIKKVLKKPTEFISFFFHQASSPEKGFDQDRRRATKIAADALKREEDMLNTDYVRRDSLSVAKC